MKKLIFNFIKFYNLLKIQTKFYLIFHLIKFKY